MNNCKFKKIIFILSSVFVVMLMSITVFAGELGDFKITGGVLKEYESTFDDKRIITGVAPQNTEVTITVFTYDEDEDEDVILDTYTFTVGVLKAFSQTIEFEIGENYIEIYAVNDDDEMLIEGIINRKPIELKRELENSIVLPSGTIKS